MRWTAFLLLCLTVGGCTTQAVGQRCQQNADCNTDTDVCRNELNPGNDCDQQSCICCPSDPTAAQAVAACRPRTTPVTDAGTRPTTDNGMSTVTDTGVRPDTGSSATPDAGITCTSNSGCPIGNYCGGTTCGGSGSCLPLPMTCPGVFEPVCGCNNTSYLSACDAARAGVRVSAMGQCGTTAPDAGSPIDASFSVDTGTTSDLGVTPDVPASVD